MMGLADLMLLSSSQQGSSNTVELLNSTGQAGSSVNTHTADISGWGIQSGDILFLFAEADRAFSGKVGSNTMTTLWSGTIYSNRPASIDYYICDGSETSCGLSVSAYYAFSVVHVRGGQPSGIGIAYTAGQHSPIDPPAKSCSIGSLILTGAIGHNISVGNTQWPADYIYDGLYNYSYSICVTVSHRIAVDTIDNPPPISNSNISSGLSFTIEVPVI